MKTRKMVYIALLSAIAIILHMVDHYLSAPLPFGVKFGIANIISLMAIELYGIQEMWMINIMRVIISGLLTGSIMSYPFFMSCGGVFLSSVALSILHIFRFLPVVSMSIISAICHNIGQIIVISLIISSTAVVPYIFVMLISAIPTGILTALIAQEALKRIKT
ncbi:MAG: Gx transporter family protein [Erysipelotrichaceae bacterium]|nr:Gx transporter family protein [Erysipelotrichaceae bacterium]